MSEPKKVGISDLLRGSIEAMPDTAAVVRGLGGMVMTRPNSHQSIGKVIEHWAKKKPNAAALRFDDQIWSYDQFNRWANRLARCFQNEGVKTGDVVAILAKNQPEALACVAATVKLGAVAGLLNHNQRGEVLTHSIELIQPKVLVVAEDCLEAIETTQWLPTKKNGCGFFCIASSAQVPDGWSDLEKAAQSLAESNLPNTGKIQANQPCFYIFTSGTTGLPKASVMTHYRWLASRAGMGAATLRLQSDDVFYVCLPLYHNNALTVSWAAVLSAGACYALDRKFSASGFWDRIREYEATAFCYIGELLRYLLNQAPTPKDQQHKVRVIVGNGLRPEIWDEFVERFGISRICEFYGASESNVGFINAFGVSQTAGFTPMPFAIAEFDAVAEELIRSGKKNFGKRVKRGGVGLLISPVTKAQPFDGYTDAAATEKKLLRDVFKKGDCWLNSGDLVRDQGFSHIQFVDRVGDTFRWKGENVATGEVEGVLAQYRDIEHAVVYGVEVPNCDGRAGMAALTLAAGCELDGQDLAQFLHARLPAYAVPLFLRLRPEQETTGTFKYRKVELKESGFDPSKVDEPLFGLLNSAAGFEPITAEKFAAIETGKLRI